MLALLGAFMLLLHAPSVCICVLWAHASQVLYSHGQYFFIFEKSPAARIFSSFPLSLSSFYINVLLVDEHCAAVCGAIFFSLPRIAQNSFMQMWLTTCQVFKPLNPPSRVITRRRTFLIAKKLFENLIGFTRRFLFKFLLHACILCYRRRMQFKHAISVFTSL